MGLLHLVQQVRDVFATEGVTAAVHLGENEPHSQINQGTGRANRVVFVPGDEQGKGGRYGPARKPGRNPRPVATWHALARVYVWSVDLDDRAEEAQYEAAWQLHDWTVLAIHRSCFSNYVLSGPQWLAQPRHLKFGKELYFLLEVAVPVLDTPYPEIAGGTVGHNAETVISLKGGDEPAC